MTPTLFTPTLDELEKKDEFSRLNSKQKMYNKKSKFGGRKKFEYSRLNSTFVKKVSSAGCTQNS